MASATEGMVVPAAAGSEAGLAFSATAAEGPAASGLLPSGLDVVDDVWRVEGGWWLQVPDPTDAAAAWRSSAWFRLPPQKRSMLVVVWRLLRYGVYLPACHPPTFLPACLPSYLPACLPACLPA